MTENRLQWLFKRALESRAQVQARRKCWRLGGDSFWRAEYRFDRRQYLKAKRGLSYRAAATSTR